KAMKKIAGPIRTELAQYRELAAFAQFGSDLDKDTLNRLRQGERIVEILKQPQHKPLSMENQVLILYAVTHKYLQNVKVEKALDFERELLAWFERRHHEITDEIRDKGDMPEELENRLKAALDEFMKEVKV
ncbi:MAG: F0F1 ATP synthase subunit alpha, partial [Defluviitaleaceae bacterium]|nr:F0F1 ATP synthase subunit alpha [Defluviitaleaceae bacterium]